MGGAASGPTGRVRRAWRWATAGLAGLVATMAAASVHAQALPETVPGLIVKLKPTTANGRESPQQAREQLSRVFAGKPLPLGTVRRTGRDAQSLRWARDLTADEARRLMESLRQDPRVAWVAPNVREQLLQATPVIPDDPLFASRQWWLGASSGSSSSRGVPNIAAAWSSGTTGASPAVNVAVLDTGLLRTHPDLGGARFSAGYDMVTDEDGLSGDGDGRDADFSDPGDAVATNECPGGNVAEESSWHGSRIAGMLGALTNNGIGVAGINRGARVVSVRVAGKCGALVSDIIDGMRWAAGLEVAGVPVNPNPARIINISFGSQNACGDAYSDVLEELTQAGVVVVAAAGNQNAGVNRPANCPDVIGVGAVKRNGTKATYSNVGSGIDVMTVGGDASDGGLVTTDNDGDAGPGANSYRAVFGTSFSAPIVSGVASLMLSVNPDLTRDQLIDGLRGTARPHVRSGAGSLPMCPLTDGAGSCYCTTAACGAGLLDAPAALAYAADPSVEPTPPDDEDDSGGGGGGAVGGGWLLALALAVGLVACAPRTAAARRRGR